MELVERQDTSELTDMFQAFLLPMSLTKPNQGIVTVYTGLLIDRRAP